MEYINYVNKILCGDSYETLKLLPDNCMDCMITSPPYYGLRDYGVDGQIGKEEHYNIFLDRLMAVFLECKRVLKPTGTMFIVIGDSYAGGDVQLPKYGKGKMQESIHYAAEYPEASPHRHTDMGIPHKSLMLIPERLMIQMVDNGFILRNILPWIKSNHLPSNAIDRFTNGYELVIYATKSGHYYFNADGIRREHKLSDRWTYEKPKYRKQGDIDDPNLPSNIRQLNRARPLQPDAWYDDPNDSADMLPGVEWPEYELVDESQIGYDGKMKGLGLEAEQFASPRARNERLRRKLLANTGANNTEPYQENKPHRMRLKNKSKNVIGVEEGMYGEDKGSRGRIRLFLSEHYSSSTGGKADDILVFNTMPSTIKHFAQFPQSMIAYLLKAGCPKEVCALCGIPKEPIVERKVIEYKAKPYTAETQGIRHGTGKSTLGNSPVYRQVIGYKTCKCNAGFIPGIVLDPFMGSGTTAIVAKNAGLNYCGIELNPKYVKVSEARLKEINAIQAEMEI